jgi:hypothetical protein
MAMGGLSIPSGPAGVTAEWLDAALRSSGASGGATVTAVKPTTIGEGSGFIGQLAQVTVRYDGAPKDAPTSLVAKFPGASVAGREIGNLFDFYHREVRFYREVAPQIDLRTPRCYYSDMNRDTQEYILLLEDLAPARVGDHAAGCQIAEAELSLSRIAKFHATWWQSPKLQQFAEWMPVVDAPVHRSAEASFQQAWGPFIENFGGKITPAMRSIGERIGQNVIALQTSISDEPHTVVHADFRTDNLFFGTPEGGADFAVIDWQIACRGRGVFDVAYLLCGGLDAPERRAHEQRLVKLYHDVLVQNGVTRYSFEQCWREYRRMALYVFVYVVISLGTLDFANERGLALFDAWLRRSSAAIEELDAAEEMPL